MATHHVDVSVRLSVRDVPASPRSRRSQPRTGRTESGQHGPSVQRDGYTDYDSASSPIWQSPASTTVPGFEPSAP